MTPKQQLDKLAAYLLAQKEEVNVQLDYNEIASILSDVKQDLTEHEVLKKDVSRFLEVIPKPVYRPLHCEAYDLYDKLKKGVAK